VFGGVEDQADHTSRHVGQLATLRKVVTA
jgi:hypothetical protein